MSIRLCVHLGSYSFGIQYNQIWSIRDFVHSGSSSFGMVIIRDFVHLGLCPFGIVSIRNRVHPGSCPFGIVFIRDSIHIQNFVYSRMCTSFGNAFIRTSIYLRCALLTSVHSDRFIRVICIDTASILCRANSAKLLRWRNCKKL